MRTSPMPSSTSPLATDCSGKFCGPVTTLLFVFLYVKVEVQTEKLFLGEKIAQGIFFLHFLLVVENLLQLCEHKNYAFCQNSNLSPQTSITNLFLTSKQKPSPSQTKPNHQNKQISISCERFFFPAIYLLRWFVTAMCNFLCLQLACCQLAL